MPFEQHQERTYAKDVPSVYAAGVSAADKLGGKLLSSDQAKAEFTARFPKTILGKTLGERTELSFQVKPAADGALIIVDAFPLDVLERKLMFGARKGVTLTVVSWFITSLEMALGLQ